MSVPQPMFRYYPGFDGGTTEDPVETNGEFCMAFYRPEAVHYM